MVYIDKWLLARFETGALKAVGEQASYASLQIPGMEATMWILPVSDTYL